LKTARLLKSTRNADFVCRREIESIFWFADKDGRCLSKEQFEKSALKGDKCSNEVWKRLVDELFERDGTLKADIVKQARDKGLTNPCPSLPNKSPDPPPRPPPEPTPKRSRNEQSDDSGEAVQSKSKPRNSRMVTRSMTRNKRIIDKVPPSAASEKDGSEGLAEPPKGNSVGRAD
jgi:hypothetical protein